MLIKYLFCQFALDTYGIELKDSLGFAGFFFFWLEEGYLLIGYTDKKKNTSSTVLGKFNDKELGSSW